MKRAPFLGSAAALVLSACSGRTFSRALPPGLAGESSSRSAASSAAASAIGTPADAIPSSVLSHPIVGEAFRFDRGIAPAGWMLMDGRTLDPAVYVGLFKMLRTVGGGDGVKTFMLPKPKQGWIIAVDGMFPSTPTAISASVRANTLQNSLGAGAHAAISRKLSPKQQQLRDARAAAVRAQQQLAQPIARGGSPTPTPSAAAARNARLRNDARDSVLAVLAPANRAQVDTSLAQILAGRINTADAAQRLAGALSTAEASSIMDAFDRTQRLAGGAADARVDLIADAARYAVTVTFSDAQLAQLAAMPDAG